MGDFRKLLMEYEVNEKRAHSPGVSVLARMSAASRITAWLTARRGVGMRRNAPISNILVRNEGLAT